MKKLISVVLALAMILSLSAGVFAADGSTTIYFDAAEKGWTNVNAYCWDADGNAYVTWPGAAMTNVEGTVWSYEVPDGYPNIIFNNGTSQTGNLTIPTDGKNVHNGTSWGTLGSDDFEELEMITLYVDVAAMGWSAAYIYSWEGSAPTSGWPGDAMTLVEGTIYSATIAADTPVVIFNNGNGGEGNQTDNLNLPTDGANMWDGSAWTTYTVSGGEEGDEESGSVIVSNTATISDGEKYDGISHEWTVPSDGTVTISILSAEPGWAYAIEQGYYYESFDSAFTPDAVTYSFDVTAGDTYKFTFQCFDATAWGGWGDLSAGTISYEITFSGESGEIVTPDTPEPGTTMETAIDATNNAWHYIEAGETVWFMFDDSYDAMWNGVYSQMLNINSGAEYAVTYNEMEVPVDADGYVNYEMYSRNYSGVYYITVTNLSEEKAFFTISASDRPEYVNTYEYVYVGDNDITLDPSATYTLWEFEPTETGTYLITVPNADALVGDWGAFWYPQDNTADKTNTLEWTCTSVGQSLLIGVSVDAESTVMTIELKEAYIPDPIIDWIIWENIYEVTPYEGDGELVAIDVTDDIADVIYICEDGTMRYGSETGPIVVADLAGSIVNFLEAYGYGQLKVAYVGEDGEVILKVDFNEALMEYYYAGVVYMNEELAAMLYDIGTNKGWYDPDVLGFYLWKDADGNITAEVDPEMAWLFPCYYIEGTEITETPEDPETPETPEDPETPEVNPGTSDYSVAGLVVAMMAATAGAVVIGKKKEF